MNASRWGLVPHHQGSESLQTADQRPVGDDRQLGHVPRRARGTALFGAGKCVYE